MKWNEALEKLQSIAGTGVPVAMHLSIHYHASGEVTTSCAAHIVADDMISGHGPTWALVLDDIAAKQAGTVAPHREAEEAPEVEA